MRMLCFLYSYYAVICFLVWLRNLERRDADCFDGNVGVGDRLRDWFAFDSILKCYTFDVLRAKILYGTKATKPDRYTFYTEAKPDKIEVLPECIKRKGGAYALQDFWMGFMTPETQKKRIDVSSGTDIRLLQYYMRMSNFWELKPWSRPNALWYNLFADSK